MERNVQAFNKDVQGNEGYLYTTKAKLSSRLANQRLTEATLACFDFAGKSVIDVGCGDGTYSVELIRAVKLAKLVGVDAADKAIELARVRAAGLPADFVASSAYELPYPDDSFDVAHIRGVLHHLDRPEAAMKEALRVARAVVVIEPNGYNPVLKVIEKVSPYHREHDEKSYTAGELNRWSKEAGAQVVTGRWVGLVPFFGPDWFARLAKLLEPVVESIRPIAMLGCGVYVFVAKRGDLDPS